MNSDLHYIAATAQKWYRRRGEKGNMGDSFADSDSTEIAKTDSIDIAKYRIIKASDTFPTLQGVPYSDLTITMNVCSD